ncbi:MAG: hypothetical protein HZB67_05475, partial [Candidatus Aenigmarchaeota archaeon]|nr:hypothetical protein [Candidatus Aenigmarchaeota archaeon]
AKAEAAKANGGTLLLIPEGQMQNSRSERTRSCRMENGRQLCRVVYQHVENATMLGIDVRAVHSIQDAADYFLAA